MKWSYPFTRTDNLKYMFVWLTLGVGTVLLHGSYKPLFPLYAFDVTNHILEKFVVKHPSYYLKRIEPVPCDGLKFRQNASMILSDWITRDELLEEEDFSWIGVIGAPGVGKSTFVRQWASAVLGGRKDLVGEFVSPETHIYELNLMAIVSSFEENETLDDRLEAFKSYFHNLTYFCKHSPILIIDDAHKCISDYKSITFFLKLLKQNFNARILFISNSNDCGEIAKLDMAILQRFQLMDIEPLREEQINLILQQVLEFSEQQALRICQKTRMYEQGAKLYIAVQVAQTIKNLQARYPEPRNFEEILDLTIKQLAPWINVVNQSVYCSRKPLSLSSSIR